MKKPALRARKFDRSQHQWLLPMMLLGFFLTAGVPVVCGSPIGVVADTTEGTTSRYYSTASRPGSAGRQSGSELDRFVAASTAARVAKEEPSIALSIGVTSRALATVFIEPEAVWRSGLLGRETAISVRLEIPALLAAIDGLDTASLAFAVSQEMFLSTGPRVSNDRHLRPSLRTLLALGADTNRQVLGSFTSVTAAARVDLGLQISRFRIGLIVGWSGALATYWTPSESVVDTFEDAGSAAPEAGWLGADRGRFRCGLSIRGRFTDAVAVYAEVSSLYTPNPFVSGFDGMMFGQFPFHCVVGVRIFVDSTRSSTPL